MKKRNFSWILGLFEMMFLASAYPGFQRALLRSTRRGPVLDSSFRYLACATQKTNNRWQRQSQPQSTLESEKVQGKLADEKQQNVSNQTESISQLTNSSNNSTTPSFLSRSMRSLRKGAGAVTSTAGFLSSSATSMATDQKQWHRSRPLVEAFQLFLNSSGIDLELSQSLNYHLLRNIVVLGRIQQRLFSVKSRRDQAKATTTRNNNKIPTREEALRYMRYATAVYGSTMIAAAEMDARGIVDTRLSPLTQTRISEHINVPEEDIVLVDVDYDGDGKHLRHFVAVDHANRKIVLAIRGTFNLAEIVVDVAAFSRPCFGGEAHSEMMTMAERVWTNAGGTIRYFLKKHEDYELIVTGHSLGAGCGCLLTIMCQNQGGRLIEGRKMRCFAYAAPPVFTPLMLVPQAVQSTINYIHEEDVVPFLSVDSVRHVFASIRAIEDYMQGSMSRYERVKLAMGITEPNEDLIEAVRIASSKRLVPKKGAPVLSIPAASTIWMNEQEDGSYDYEICDPAALSKLGPVLSTRMVEHHLPPRYEHAFENLNLDP
ncbi:Sn1-specific diacylglycerol lipase beta [Seminavis robusta]|uniref:sn-1-specific diacylglycerol lipase n=1 Tax=Seminavis robusta TaxID=568900 RepID=A0A9N8H1W4_9STRA|nr:Sn1-specific diacylglycerol lipase beta [Seminavis robusta]|eukprot:Sro50_g029160.1 Sn1-specific diacylglycerol lipase beta (543) ;mRNA; f:94118-95854